MSHPLTTRLRHQYKTSASRPAIAALPRVKRPRKFIAGPIPYDWLARANSLPGKAGAVAVALYFLAGVTKSLRFRLTAEIEELAQCNRQAVYSALTELEQAQLISAVRRSGAKAVVTILE